MTDQEQDAFVNKLIELKNRANEDLQDE